jgi:phthalate 4,5-dioxygenase
MLTHEQDKTLTDVSPGAPMHKYWKKFWIPALRSEALAAGGAPKKVELLCEPYVAFRTHEGRVGFLNEACPHRGISLAMARNENNALTCIFHGWTFDAEGNCVRMPTESDQGICKRVNNAGYPTREAGGIVWVYLGGGEPPVFSDYAFTHYTRENTRPRASYVEANWVQNLETLLDSAHIGLLHQNTTGNTNLPQAGLQLANANHTPKYTFEATPYGLRSYASRSRDDGQVYLRVTEYVSPGTAFIGTTSQEAAFVIMVVPVNNTRSLQWYVYWDARQPIDENLPDFALVGTDLDDDNFAASRQGKPSYGQDRAAMERGESWTGIPGVIFEDYAVAESIPIVDRTKEFLGSGDVAIVRMRRDLLSRVAEPEAVHERVASVSYRSMRALAEVIPADTDIMKFTEQKRQERDASFS